MYQYRDREGEYWADNYDVDDMDEDMQEDLSGRVMGETGFEDEYYGCTSMFPSPMYYQISLINYCALLIFKPTIFI